jgi:predicted transcriptional regulator
MSQGDAAQTLKVSRSTLSRYMNNRATPKGDTYTRVTGLLAQPIVSPSSTEPPHQLVLQFEEPLSFEVAILRKPVASTVEVIIRMKSTA